MVCMPTKWRPVGRRRRIGGSGPLTKRALREPGQAALGKHAERHEGEAERLRSVGSGCTPRGGARWGLAPY